MKYKFDYSLLSLVSKRISSIADKLQLCQTIFIADDSVKSELIIESDIEEFDDSTKEILALTVEMLALLANIADGASPIIRKSSVLADLLAAGNYRFLLEKYTGEVSYDPTIKQPHEFQLTVDDVLASDANLEEVSK